MSRFTNSANSQKTGVRFTSMTSDSLQPHDLSPPTYRDSWDQNGSCVTQLDGNPNVVLLKMLAEHRTGSLRFIDAQDPAVGWQIYLDQGKIVFAESTSGHLQRAIYLLRLVLPNAKLVLPNSNDSSIYSILCQTWANYNLPSGKLQQILAYSTQEALIQVFAIHKCEISYDAAAYFPPVVKSSSFSALIDPIEPWISQWRGIRQEIRSPFQRLFILDWDAFFNLIAFTRTRYQQINQLNLGLGKNYTLYELAAHLRMDVRELAVVLHPLIKAGAIGVKPFQEVQLQQRPLVASLTEKSLNQKLTKRTLERSGFDVLMLKNSHHLMTQLQEKSPDVMLLDSNVSNLNSFDLCRSIRKIEKFKTLPIILLLKEKRLLSQARGQWAGVTDYLIDPIRPQDLLNCVDQWAKV